METFVAGYVIVWFAVVLYVTWLGRRQRRLEQTCDSLRSQLQSPEHSQTPASRAA